MTTASNLYAEKIFGEHPVALWALDDTVTFVSLLSDSDKSFQSSSWDFSNVQKSQTNPATYPMINENISSFTTTNNTTSATIILKNGIQSNSLNQNIGFFTIGCYFFTEDPNISSLKIGYTDGTTPVYQTYSIGSQKINNWIFISATFGIPSTQVQIKPYIAVSYSSANTSRSFSINGLSFGQNSENFSTENTGIIPQNLPSNIFISGKGIPASAYGLQDINGYYLSDGYTMFAYNYGVPMVYGASNTTKIIPASGPSLILPGKGFLNKTGENKEYTAEFWLKVYTNTVIPKRIFGPVASTDGLYVDGPFLVLKIGDVYGRYLVKEWERPMLIDIKYSSQSVSLLINGESVMLLDLSSATKLFPLSKANEKDQDWLGFYAYSDVSLLEIDCVAIYTYLVPDIVAKRRFVYGQAVDFPENANTGYNGYDVFVDYKYANYANNYSYPDLARWSNGIANNLDVYESYISSPNYEFPRMVTASDFTFKDLQVANQNINSSNKPFINLKPNNNWGYTYLAFDSLNFLNDGTYGFYGIFANTQSLAVQTLFFIYNKITGDYFKIVVENSNTVKYVLKYGSSEEVVLFQESGTELNKQFSVGISLPKILLSSNSNYDTLKTFFSNIGALQVYIGGNDSLQNQFVGNIYSISFCDRNNVEKISQFFNEDGFMNNPEFQVFDQFNNPLLEIAYSGGNEEGGSDNYTQLNVLDGGEYNTFSSDTIYSHIPSYGFIASGYLDVFKFNILTDSYWQDYIPLKYFAKYINNSFGEQEYGLDYLQFNIDYPQLKRYLNDRHDSRGSSVKTYVSFKNVNSGAYHSPSSITYTEALNKNMVVIPETDPSLPNYWLNTRYEVVSDSIIYMPGNANFNNLNLVVHVEITSLDGIDSAVQVSKLQLSANALNKNGVTNIGTRFGNDIAISAKNGLYPSYSERVPVCITTQSFPYLYLSSNSGIGIKDLPKDQIERYLSISVNPNEQSFYLMASMQMFYKYNKSVFPSTPEKAFAVEAVGIDKNTNALISSLIEFYVVAVNTSGTIGKIIAINASDSLEYTNLNFYINGALVNNPHIAPYQWNVIGLEFPNPLNFAQSSLGNISIYQNSFVNNIAYYQITEAQNLSDIVYRRISQVKFMLNKPSNDDGGVTFWEDFLVGATTYNYPLPISWSTVLVIPVEETVFASISPKNLYREYLGINKFVVQDKTKLLFNGYKYTAYKDIVWQTNIVTPV